MNRYQEANEGIHAPEELKKAVCRPGGRKRPLWAGAVAAVLVVALVAGVIFWPGGSPLVPSVSAADAYEPDYSTPYDGAELDEAYLTAIRQFAARAAGELLTDGESSTAYSPSTLYTALSMVAELTEGDYLTALLDTLGADGVDMLRQGTGDLWRYLCANPDIKKPGKVTLANSLWLSEDRQYNGDTLQNLADYYYVSSYTGDMVNDIPGLVSQWVQKQTNGLLDCRPETDADTAALLLSAIYFYDKWAQPFNKSATISGRFQTAGGEYADCNYMERTEKDRAYYRGNGVTAAVQYLQNGGKMLFILPDEGNSPAGVLADTDLLASLLAWESLDKGTGTVNWMIPRFTLSSTLDLRNGLTALGLGALFDEDSNTLSKLKLAGNDGAYISHAEQGTSISIDETGCEAASYVEIAATDGEPWNEETISMCLTRPFVFAILSDNDVPLFLGVVNQP